METIYLIQDVNSKEYYWSYGTSEGFDMDVSEATTFESEQKAMQEMQQEYLKDFFSGRLIEIKKYYSFDKL